MAVPPATNGDPVIADGEIAAAEPSPAAAQVLGALCRGSLETARDSSASVLNIPSELALKVGLERIGFLNRQTHAPRFSRMIRSPMERISSEA